MAKHQTQTGKGRQLWQLFYSMLYISAFTFGGGFVIVTLMKKKFVDGFGWLTEAEMLDMTAIAQSSPGAIAVNAAILVGWQVAGFWGMVCAVVGTILPPMVILSVISVFYQLFATNRYVALVLGGMQAGVAAVIFDVVCNLGQNVIKGGAVLDICLMVVAFVASFFLNVNVIVIILAAALIGVIRALLARRKGAAA